MKQRIRRRHAGLAAELAVNGITADRLADEIGVHPNTISRILNLHREPRLKTARKIAEALHASLETLGWGWMEREADD